MWSTPITLHILHAYHFVRIYALFFLLLMALPKEGTITIRIVGLPLGDYYYTTLEYLRTILPTRRQ